MKNLQLLMLISAVLMMGSCKDDEDPQTQDVVYKIDTYTDGGIAEFQGGFVAGEEAAVTLGPVAQSATVKSVSFLFGGGNTTNATSVIIKIYEENNGALDPGTILYSMSHTITPSSDALQVVDISAANLILPAGRSIRVSVELTTDGLPSVARDDGANFLTAKNWVKVNGSWNLSSTVNIIGNWIIRATVEEQI